MTDPLTHILYVKCSEKDYQYLQTIPESKSTVFALGILKVKELKAFTETGVDPDKDGGI